MVFQSFDNFRGRSIEVYRPTSEPRNCFGCGRCCYHLRAKVFPSDKLNLSAIDADGYLRQDEDGACIFLDRKTNLCGIYEKRPRVCRDFARGSNPKCFDMPCELLTVLNI